MNEVEIGGIKVRARKQGRLLRKLRDSGRKTYIIRNIRFIRILDTVDFLKKHGYDILQVDRSVLVQIHQEVQKEIKNREPPARSTAYEEVNFLIRLVMKLRLA